MTVRVSVDINTRNFQQFLTRTARKQVPFATARGLTLTARDARDEVRRNMPERFEIRSQRVVAGVQFNRATKRDLVAEVGSRDDFMVLQETGGIKRARRAVRVAVPTSVIKRTRSGKIPKARRPAAVLARGRGFIGRGGKVIFERTRTGARPLFILARQVRIEPRFRLRDDVQKIANRKLERNVQRALVQAIRTAR